MAFDSPSGLMRIAKLVRDKIPDIIRAAGEVPNVWTASPEAYPQLLRHKLQEEIREYLDNNDPIELADILEVVRTLAATEHGLSPEGLEALRAQKEHEKGGFNGRLVWVPHQ